MEIFIYLIGGILAGVATGLIGLSAATIIAPLFATMLGMDVYLAIGIALASDVFASASSAGNYIRNKNIDIKNSAVLAVCVVSFTIIGSYLSKDMNPYNLNGTINIMVLFLGIRFIVYPVKKSDNPKFINPTKLVIFQTIFFGIVIGMINGYFGAGGGLSMLAVLTMLLGYDLKRAIGTSVFIMTFTALVGASTHFIIGGIEIIPLIVTSISAFIGAVISSAYANKINEVTLNKVIGVFLIIYGISLIIVYYT